MVGFNLGDKKTCFRNAVYCPMIKWSDKSLSFLKILYQGYLVLMYTHTHTPVVGGVRY